MLTGVAMPASAQTLPAPDQAVPNQLLEDLVSALAPINEAIPGVGNLVGNITPTEVLFNEETGQLDLVGQLTGTLTSLLGEVTEINQTVTTPLAGAAASAACQILHLNLQPIHLDLLGLVVDLQEVDLLVTAVPGEGNLLGNLLCSVAGLLDPGPGGTPALAALLNSLLGLTPTEPAAEEPAPGEEPAPAPAPGEEPAPAPAPGEEPAPAPGLPLPEVPVLPIPELPVP